MSIEFLTTKPQHIAALERAQEVRRLRADLKRRVADRRLDVADVILLPPSEAETMKVSELLLAMPRFGMARVRRHLRFAGIPEAKVLGGLTGRQRDALVEAVRAFGGVR
jgi:hypothetical protein